MLHICVETINDIREEPERIIIFNILLQNIFQNLMIDTCEEFLDIAFEYPAGSGIVFRYFLSKDFKPRHCFVCTLS
jgi:hypothetical protein